MESGLALDINRLLRQRTSSKCGHDRAAYARVFATFAAVSFWDKRIQCQMNHLASRACLRQTANRAEKITDRRAALALADRHAARVALLALERHRRKRWPVARGIS